MNKKFKNKKLIFISIVLILGIIAVLTILLYYPGEGLTDQKDKIGSSEKVFDSLPKEPLTPPPLINLISRIT